jgi:uroporphyrinogen III methyltransferase/synthase
VGAGPGAPDLITLRGERALRSADAVVYDALVSEALVALAPPHALRIDVGKRGHAEPPRSQEELNALLVRLAREGKRVVRLKGGDPYVFGRGGEEATACREAGVPVEVIPGVSSAVGALAYAGIPVTDRRHAASFAVVTGHADPSRAREEIRWAELARGADTLVILMGMRNLAELVKRLVEGGRDPETPAAAVMNATLPGQRVVATTLGALPDRVAEAKLGAPAAVVVGEVVRLRPALAWFEALPLFAKRVLVTRAAAQAATWCRALLEAGAEPVAIPLIRTVVLPEARAEALAERLAGADLVVLTSANAARALGERAGDDALRRARARVACVGAATADAAVAAGFAPSRVYAAGSRAAALVAALREREALAGARVLVPRAERVREEVGAALAAAGALVDEVAVYRTEPEAVDPEQLARETARCDALTFASPSAVRQFAAVLGGDAPRLARPAVKLAIGRATAEALAEAGLPADVVAETPSAEGVVAALAGVFARRAQEEPS